MEPFKNFFSPELVRGVAMHLQRHMRGFDGDGFVASIIPLFPDLELKQRAQLIADRLHDVLPSEPGKRAAVISSVLHPDELDHADKHVDDQGVCGWAILPFTMVVGQHGVSDFDRSLDLMREMTKRFSSEFGIRYFLLADQSRTLRAISKWTTDPNRHVRRLVSEGTRPRLPWAMQLPSLMRDPSPAIPLLEALRDDTELYVRRSVANHLNDISKDHPEILTSIAKNWHINANAERKALLRHACRSLIKRGNSGALAVFGQTKPKLELDKLKISARTLAMGDTLEFCMPLRSTAAKTQRLTIDYVLHLLKANGRTAPRVFKGGNMKLKAGESKLFRRSHTFREVTTRRHYGGEHALSLRINGVDTPPVSFWLKVPASAK
ncbi:MAG: DNA alkylation repair protein [Aestuariivirga sp.]